MRKVLNLLVFFCFVALLLSSCKKDENDVFGGKTSRTPTDIIGNSLVFYTDEMKKQLQASDFGYNGDCKVPMLTSDYKPVTTPMYTYTKVSDNTSNFEIIYDYKLRIGSSYLYWKYTYNVVMTFQSSNEGTYAGSQKMEYKNTDFPKLNKNTIEDVSGMFQLY